MMSIWFVTAILIAFFLGSKHSATFLEVGESVSPATGLGWVGGLGPSFGKAGPDFSGPVNYRALNMELSQELNDSPSAGTSFCLLLPVLLSGLLVSALSF